MGDMETTANFANNNNLPEWQVKARAGAPITIDPWEIANRIQQQAQQAILKSTTSTRIGSRSSSTITDAIIQSRSGVVASAALTDDTMYDAMRQDESYDA